MILVEKTLKEFGYKPADLATYSKALVWVSCIRCNKNRKCIMANYSNRRTDMCKICRTSELGKLQVIKRHRRLKKELNSVSKLDIHPAHFLELFKSAFILVGNDRVYPVICSGKNGKSFGLTLSRSILLSLGIADHKKPTTTMFKSALVEFYKKQTKHYKRIVLNILFEKHQSSANASLLNISYRIYKNLYLDNSDVTIEPYQSRLIKVTYGSFFVNGQWIHIG